MAWLRRYSTWPTNSLVPTPLWRAPFLAWQVRFWQYPDFVVLHLYCSVQIRNQSYSLYLFHAGEIADHALLRHCTQDDPAKSKRVRFGQAWGQMHRLQYLPRRKRRRTMISRMKAKAVLPLGSAKSDLGLDTFRYHLRIAKRPPPQAVACHIHSPCALAVKTVKCVRMLLLAEN